MVSTQVFRPFLESFGAVLLDGGLATELERRGADLRHPLWSARLLHEDPSLICRVHEDYYHAGADVGISASYQASLDGLRRQGFDDARAAELMRLSVRLVREARDRFLASASSDRPRPLVAASLGAYGAARHDGSEYRGNYHLSVRQLMDWHRPRLEILLDAQPDLFACETIPCLEEGEALARLFEEYRQVPAWLSFSCRDGRNLCQGQPFAECAALVAGNDTIVALGVNCTAPAHVLPLVQTLPANLEQAIVVYPNSGESWDASAHAWNGAAAREDWSDFARRWRAAGITLLGGCCRTTPATIHCMRQSVAFTSNRTKMPENDT